MGLKVFNLPLSKISIDNKVGLKDYSLLYNNGIRLKNILLNSDTVSSIKSGRTPSRFNSEYWDGEHEFLTMSSVDQLMYTINECYDKISDTAIEDDNTLYQAQTGSLLISNAMTVGLSFITDRPMYINQNVFELKIDENKANKEFLKWYFNICIRPLFTKVFQSKYLSKSELSRITIPNIPKSKQDEVVALIEPIEQQIKELKNSIIPANEIINEVFAREFGFDLDKFEELKKIKIYHAPFNFFANNRDLRNSTKFHREAGQFVTQELTTRTTKQIKDFLAEPIVLGTSVSPNDYTEDGEYYYISMANIKTWTFDSMDSKLVSEEYSKKNLNKTVAKDDILLARSGEGTIGKVALITDEDINGIFADFTMRIRLKNYNVLFAYYYFRTSYFQYLIEIHKKGLGNNTNIFPSQIQEFPLLDIPLSEQNRIVKEIQTELDKQNIYTQQIQEQRNKIDSLIERAIEGVN